MKYRNLMTATAVIAVSCGILLALGSPAFIDYFYSNTVSTALRGLFRMAVPADREPYLAAPFPLRADGVGLAFADLLAQSTDEDRGSGSVAVKALIAAIMKTRAFEVVKKAEKRRSAGINGKGDFMRVLATPSGRQFRRRKNEPTCVFIR
jgi:hypothetical protein